MKPEDTFQNRLSTALKIRNVKPVELHEKTGISESLLSKYLSGNAVARQKKLSILSDALDINPVWLMGYDVPMTNQDSSIYQNTVIIEKFAKRFTQLIKENNTDINDLLNYLGIKSKSTIYRYMNAEMSPKITTVKYLAEYFNVDLTWLMGYDVDKEKYIVNVTPSQLFYMIENKYGPNSMKLLDFYKDLNTLGKEKAIENIKDLTEIQKYVEKKTNIQEA